MLLKKFRLIALMPRILRGNVAVLAVALFAFIAATLPALAQTETILYSFCRPGCG
jgi:hypothetical protein